MGAQCSDLLEAQPGHVEFAGGDRVEQCVCGIGLLEQHLHNRLPALRQKVAMQINQLVAEALVATLGNCAQQSREQRQRGLWRNHPQDVARRPRRFRGRFAPGPRAAAIRSSSGKSAFSTIAAQAMRCAAAAARPCCRLSKVEPIAISRSWCPWARRRANFPSRAPQPAATAQLDRRARIAKAKLKRSARDDGRRWPEHRAAQPIGLRRGRSGQCAHRQYQRLC